MNKENICLTIETIKINTKIANQLLAQHILKRLAQSSTEKLMLSSKFVHILLQG